jgi:fatty-acyl-CoA synthase
MLRAPFNISSIADIKVIEKTPYQDRLFACSSYQALQMSSEAFPGNCAIRYIPDPSDVNIFSCISYREFFSAITQTANAFLALGLESRGVVSSLLPNLPQTYYCFWGAEAVGVINPINPMLDAEHITSILKEAQTQVLVVSGESMDAAGWAKNLAIIEQASWLKAVLVVGQDDLPAEAGGVPLYGFDQFVSRQSAGNLQTDQLPGLSDTAALFHTGGTTGVPKLAPHTHGMELLSAQITGASFGFTGQDVGLIGLPLFHVNAAIATGLSVFLYGAEVLLPSAAGYRHPATFKNFWSLIARHKVSFFSAVPTVLSELLKQPSKGHDISSLRMAVCGAAPLSVEVKQQFEESTGLRILEGYGQTEGTVVTSLNPLHGEHKIGSVGLPLPYMGVKIVELDEHGRTARECDTDEIGTVAISGPYVFSGYQQTDKNGDIWVEEGWLNSGDLGRLDADGYLFLGGRSKDLIIRGGHNIDPEIIEEAYYKHPGVALAAAVGRPDPRVGELPVVYLQLKPGQSVSVEALMQFGAEHISERAAVPKAVYLTDSIPTSAIGKIFKPALRKDAICRLVRDEISSIDGNSAGGDVAVVDDPKYGFSVQITAAGELSGARLKELIRRLGQYAFHYEIRPL